MAVAPTHDERDRLIAQLRAEVVELKTALRIQREKAQDASNGPLFGRGLSGGFLGGLEVAIGAFALVILMLVMRHLLAA